LPADTREFVILLAARFWSAQYEWHAHRNIAIQNGLNPAIPAAIAEGRRPDGMTPDQALLYDFMQELLYRKDVSDTVYAAAIDRFGERTLLDVISTAGYFSFVSLILNAKRHPLPADAVPLTPLNAPPI
jgi:4-carboxymuconolactone decarboxylase